MKVYVVLIEERHTDVDVRLYVDKSKAIREAQDEAKELSRSGEYEEIYDSSWIWAASFSTEGDYITVLERELIGL